MRDAFASEITELAVGDPRVVLLSGDIGNRLFDRFKEGCPGRFYNCGIAEANMMTVAAGLAMTGLRPFVYTITPFVTARCLEQIRVDVCYHEQPVVIVGTGSGLSYAGNGATHHSLEDLAWMRSLPNMRVVAPGDALEVRQAVRAAGREPGPVYLRIGKKGEPRVHATPPDLVIGRGLEVRSGRDACVISTGNTLPLAVEAATRLADEGIATRVVSMHTVKPIDEELLADAFARHEVVVTVEEHSRIGGLGGAVAEWLSDQPPQAARLVRIGTPDRFLHEAGEQAHARQQMGVTLEAIVGAVHGVVGARPRILARAVLGGR